MKSLATVLLALTLTCSAQESKKWYQGGTLHKKTGADWLKASSDNRVATSADFLTDLTEPITLDARRVIHHHDLK